MGRCLVIANQTLGGGELDRAVRDCIRRDVSQFYVVVPVTPPARETVAWRGGFAETESPGQVLEATEEKARRQEVALEAAQRRAQARLDQMIAKIQSAGGTAEGQLGPEDPTQAAKEVMEDHSFDEVIVSTLPVGVSRWLSMDLPNRVARMTGASVTTVEAAPEPQA